MDNNQYIFLFYKKNKDNILFRISKSNYLLNNEKIILQIISLNNKITEKKIITFFLSKYKKIIIEDYIYFDGNYLDITDDICKINNENKNKEEFIITYDENKFLIESNKKIIKLYKNNNIFIEKLIKNNILFVDKIYNLNNNITIDKINKHKNNINIDNFENIFYFYEYEKYNSTRDKINFLFSEWTINNKIPIENNIIDFNNWYNFTVKKFILKYNYNNDINNNINIEIINIDNKYYEFNYLKKYLAHIIIYKNSDYFLLNCNYCKIGENNEYLHLNNYPTNLKYLYLFNERDEPTKRKDFFEKYLSNFKKIITENNLINYTHNIYPLFLEI